MTYWKEINGIIYELEDGVWLPKRYGKATRLRNTLSLTQLAWEYPEFIDRLAYIIFSSKDTRTLSFARSILDYLSLNQYISWKQFDSIQNLKL